MDNSRFLILGANGQLGRALQTQYPNAMALDSDGLDITDAQVIANYDWSSVDVVLNAAVFSNVDGSETTEGRVTAWQVNATGARNLSQAALEHELTLVHISSDYVFDGRQTPHSESEPFSPLGVYGQAKAAGDIAVSLVPKLYLLRTTWVIGDGKNFVRTMLGLGQKGIAPTVVADQVGRLTFTSELVRAIDHLLSTKAAYGTYNVTNEGESASWADITRKIFEISGYDLQVTDTTTAEYFAGKAGIAPRPLESTLELTKLHATGFTSIEWPAALTHYIEQEQAS